MTPADPVRLIEAAYTYVPNEAAWLSELVDASLGYGVGGGVLACAVDLGGRPRFRNVVSTPEATATSGPTQALVESVTPELARGLLAPTEFVGNASFRLNRLARDRGPATRGRKTAPLELPPLWAFVSGDGAKEAVMVGFPARKDGFAADQPYPHRDRRVLGLVGAHVSAAMRLRRSMQAENPADDRTADAATEAVLSPDGRVLHARGRGEGKSARASLSEAVVRAERARGTLRKTNAEEATTLWQALVAGRWSIVEVVERDGKRLLLARINTPGTPDLSALTRRESDVVWVAALGHSYKYIAYELGISTGTAVRTLRSAMLKLGVSTRRDLLRKLSR